jgi:hypothetical protein
MGTMDGRLPRSAGPARKLMLILLLSFLVAAAVANIEDFDESSDKEDHHRGHHKDKDDDDDHHKRGHKDDHDDHHKKDDHDDHHKKDDHDDHHKKDDHHDDHKGDHDDHKNGHKDDHDGKDGHDDDEPVEHPPILEEDKEHSSEYDELDSRLNKLTHRLNKIDEELDVRLDPGNHIKARVVEHRVELLEVDVCADRDLYYCGRADPQCVSRLFVCDGIQDCRDGEDEHHCDLPTKAGDTFNGQMLWDNCTNTQPDTISFTVTGVKTSSAFPGFPQIRLTFDIEHEDDEHEIEHSQPSVAYYRFATQNLIALHPGEEGLGLICDFDGHDPDRCVGRTVRVSNLVQCAEFIFFRETDEEDDDDEDHHHQRH